MSTRCRWCGVLIELCGCRLEHSPQHWGDLAFGSRWCHPPEHTHEPRADIPDPPSKERP